MRGETSREHVYGSRKWSKTRGITLHQTACLLGERPQRWRNVGCHVGITRAGQILWLHDFDRLVVHGNGWNTQCVGFEIDGLYAGVEGNPRTVWDNPETPAHETGMALTDAAVDSARAAIAWVIASVAARGGKLEVLGAHRQASDTRRNDPGSAIWQRVALPSMRDYNLTDGGPGFRLTQGYPIPEAWDPSRTGIPY